MAYRNTEIKLKNQNNCFAEFQTFTVT